jgi:hypothetical protein
MGLSALKQDCGLFSKNPGVSLTIRPHEGGTWCPQPSDHRSTTEISPERERARGSDKRARGTNNAGVGLTDWPGLAVGARVSKCIQAARSIERIRSNQVYLKPGHQISDGRLRSNDKLWLGSWVASGGAARL